MLYMSMTKFLSNSGYHTWDTLLTRKGTQMINSDLIKTLVIDRPNLKMNNCEKIIGGDLL